jgi:REP element-mobilizing transposase RayT
MQTYESLKHDHVHMLLRIPPKHAVLQVMGFIKGKKRFPPGS